MKKRSNHQRYAILLSVFLMVLFLSSLIYLLLPGGTNSEYIADIYQNGILIMSIPLQQTENRIFTIKGSNGCVNEIEIRSGSIGILSADCPDKLCVHQGFISDSRLPITCLPNRLVIQLRSALDSIESTDSRDDFLIQDTVTY